jgi:hypothetical protein
VRQPLPLVQGQEGGDQFVIKAARWRAPRADASARPLPWWPGLARVGPHACQAADQPGSSGTYVRRRPPRSRLSSSRLPLAWIFGAYEEDGQEQDAESGRGLAAQPEVAFWQAPGR